jgi:hypothetical protein
METALRHLENSHSISETNKQRILEYESHLEDEALTLARRVTHLVRMSRIAETLGKDFESATESDMRSLIRNLKIRKSPRRRKGSPYFCGHFFFFGFFFDFGTEITRRSNDAFVCLTLPTATTFLSYSGSIL